MSDTSSENPPSTGITPRIADNRLKKGIVGHLHLHPEIDEGRSPEGFIVRFGKDQSSVAFTINTKRMVERREIERANEAIRGAGG